MTSDGGIESTACDEEPIHIPGAIQPGGTLLIVEMEHGEILGYAGDRGNEANLSGQTIEAVLGLSLAELLEKTPRIGTAISAAKFNGQQCDAVSFLSDAHLVVEVLPSASEPNMDAAYLSRFLSLETSLEQASSLDDLVQKAAKAFHELTGYDRVLIYRFVDDNAGKVLGEYRSQHLSSFMNHHFPATDIPKQARALYVRNKVRVISDVHYTPQPIVSSSSALKSIDLSDSVLRSVSPIHIQYLKNMGLGASASMSIIKDGQLWGLVACHHHEAKTISLAVRLACQTLATSLSRLLSAREENEYYQQRLHLRAQEDELLAYLSAELELNDIFLLAGDKMATLFDADGFAFVHGAQIYQRGETLEHEQLRELAAFVSANAPRKPFASDQLSTVFEPANSYKAQASGLLAVTISAKEPIVLMWLRAEHRQVLDWAGHPHHNKGEGEAHPLTPRASFEKWSEEVSGRARPWTLAETESSGRLGRALLDTRTKNRINQLNRELTATAAENETLLRQKDFLLREVNHRVQNSLSIVAAFLRMQSRATTAEARQELQQAERRLMAVSLAHRRLYQDESVEVIDLAHYLEELVSELLGSMDAAWRKELRLDLAPLLIQTDKAVTLGLVLNELLTNLAKYAYDGQPGPATVSLVQKGAMLEMTVSDQGRGLGDAIVGTGFGKKMLQVLVTRLNGTLSYQSHDPGTSAIVTATIASNNE